MQNRKCIETYKNDLESYSLEQLRYIPAQGVWSIGQMYDHVILVALEYLDFVEICAAAVEEQKLGKTEAGEHLYRLGGFPPVKIKLPDGPENSPSNTESKEDLMRGLDQVLQRMSEWEGKVDTINPNYKVRHGGFGWLNAREWFDLIGMHFRHHLRQKNELEQKQMKRYIIGIDLGGTNIKAAVFDTEFQTVLERNDPTEAALGPSHVLKNIKKIIEEMLSGLNIDQRAVTCMGMGIPGLLDPDEGLSIFSPNFPGWENIHVVNEMKSVFDFPVFIDNDVRVNLYGEWRFGAGVGHKNIVLLTLGTGLGSGIVVDGKVLYGKTASAGEIGHMNMYREGRPCRCGSSGCLGRYVSAIGMVRTFTEKLEQGKVSMVQSWVDGHDNITAKMISEAYDQGDALAIEVMHETGRILGFGLSNAINLLNPELIIIGGGMSAAGDRLLNTVRGTVNGHSLKLSSQACKVVQASLGDKAGMIGAAAYAIQRLSS